jgi:4-amino-4-deoxy-L-arabinose transferase-like glycosyltransferase
MGAVIAVLMTWRIGRTLFDQRVAMLAAGLLAGCPLMVVEAHIATPDAMLLAGTTFAMDVARLDLFSDDRGRCALARRCLGLWTAIGLAILLKGPVLPGVVLMTVGALVIADRFNESDPNAHTIDWIRPLHLLIGMLIVIVIVSPWR